MESRVREHLLLHHRLFCLADGMAEDGRFAPKFSQRYVSARKYIVDVPEAVFGKRAISKANLEMLKQQAESAQHYWPERVLPKTKMIFEDWLSQNKGEREHRVFYYNDKKFLFRDGHFPVLSK